MVLGVAGMDASELAWRSEPLGDGESLYSQKLQPATTLSKFSIDSVQHL